MAKTKKPEKTKAPGGGGKPDFDNGVRSALIAGVVLCAVILGAGVFFMARSALSGGFSPPAAGRDTFPGADTPAVTPDEPQVPLVTEDESPEPLPELEEALNQLESGNVPSGADTVAAAGTALKPSPPPQTPPVIPAEPKGVLVFVIDDAGNNLSGLDPFLAFPAPLTIAVLPGLPNSAEAARRVRNAKKELFLHQPMENLSGTDPGPGAIKTGMGAEEIRAILGKNLKEIGPAAGMNNHEGSRATQDPAIMKTVLEFCREQGIVFLDSRTIADSAAPAAARGMAFPIARRDVFLDNEQDRDSIIKYIEEGCRIAGQNGYAIMIGHAWSPNLAAILTELYPSLIARGFYLSTVSAILNPGK